MLHAACHSSRVHDFEVRVICIPNRVREILHVWDYSTLFGFDMAMQYIRALERSRLWINSPGSKVEVDGDGAMFFFF